MARNNIEASDSASEMMVRTGTAILFVLVYCGLASALEPEEILIIANQDSAESGRIARYYCRMRGVPAKNIIALPLEANLNDTISRTRINGKETNASADSELSMVPIHAKRRHRSNIRICERAVPVFISGAKSIFRRTVSRSLSCRCILPHKTV